MDMSIIGSEYYFKYMCVCFQYHHKSNASNWMSWNTFPSACSHCSWQWVGLCIRLEMQVQPFQETGTPTARSPHSRHRSSGAWTFGNSVPALWVVFKNLGNRVKVLNFYSHFILLQTVCRKGTDCPQHPDHKDETTSAKTIGQEMPLIR